MMYAQPHERFSTVVALDPRDTRAFAQAVGDTNPIHHDADLAEKSRFGRLLASGPQTTAWNFGCGFAGRSMPTKQSRSNGW
jgi:acyl dehydratase